MESTELKQIKDFKTALKDMEPMVRDPRFLRNGRPISNFRLLPREAWANWLLCVVFQHVNNQKITFMEDEADGSLVNPDRLESVRMEHVSALEVPSKRKQTLQGEDRVVQVIEHKLKRGADYALGKILVVFHEAVGVWYPNRVGRRIADRHHFLAVYGVGLLLGNEQGYSYAVTQYEKEHSPTWKVEINADFTDWSVSRIQ